MRNAYPMERVEWEYHHVDDLQYRIVILYGPVPRMKYEDLPSAPSRLLYVTTPN